MAEQACPAAERSENRLDFETLIADLSYRFINLPSGEVDREIRDALRRVCEHLGIDLAALWQWSAAAPAAITLTHLHCAQEDLRLFQQMAQEDFPWVRQRMLEGRAVLFSSLDELPAEAALDRENGRRFGIKSNLTLPLSVGGAPPVGALGFNTLRAERDWPEALVNRLHLVAQVFTNALARRRFELTLKESEERVSLAADSAEAGLWMLDFRTRVFWLSDRTRAIYGYSPEEVITMKRFKASVHHEDVDLVRGAIDRSLNERDPFNVEYRIQPGDGRVQWIASRGRPHFTSSGDPERLTGVSTDISERKRAEEALRRSEARLASGADLAGLAFYEVDPAGGIVFADDRFRHICGVPPGRELGLQTLEFWMEHLHPDDRRRVLDMREQLHDGRVDQVSVEYRYLHPDHGQKWIQHQARVAARNTTGRGIVTLGVLRDITERKRTEEELRDLSQRLIRAHEEERALLARELHDDVTQRLAVLAIDVGRAELAAPEGALTEVMRAVRGGLMRLSEDIHSLAYQLHPSVLEELGLAEALHAECERLGRQGRIEISVDLDPPPASVGKDAALCLFRVAQEALNNVTRHARARAANVALRRMDGGLLLAVRDDGVGFDPVRPGSRRSLGLASMRERVRLVNGTLEIESAPGHGTAIIVWVPAEGPQR